MVGQEGIQKVAVGHLVHVLERIRIVGRAQLDKDVPRAAKTGSAKGSAVHSSNSVQTIGRLVLERIAVGVTFKASVAWYVKKLRSAKNLVVGNVLVLVFLNEVHCPTRSRHYDVSGVPGELVGPRVGGALGREDSATKTLVGRHLGTFTLESVKDFHGRHVVDSGIHAAFVHEYQTFGTGFGIEGLHFRTDVGGSYQMLTLTYTTLRHRKVHRRRQHRHYDIVHFHNSIEQILIAKVSRFNGDVVQCGRFSG